MLEHTLKRVREGSGSRKPGLRGWELPSQGKCCRYVHAGCTTTEKNLFHCMFLHQLPRTIVSYVSSYKKCTIKYKLGGHMCISVEYVSWVNCKLKVVQAAIIMFLNKIFYTTFKFCLISI
jgi:hypothetical protein